MDIRKIILIHQLIKTNRTGTPKTLATRLGVSERTVYTYISFFKKTLRAPIKWNTIRESYTYQSNGDINFTWKEKITK